MTATIRIHLNGEPADLPAGTSIAALIGLRGLTGKRIAVERNREIVPRGLHPDTILEEGDVIEIVHAIGGG
jgi:sulfur carrier protein